jgi:hypothetical protein
MEPPTWQGMYGSGRSAFGEWKKAGQIIIIPTVSLMGEKRKQQEATFYVY